MLIKSMYVTMLTNTSGGSGKAQLNQACNQASNGLQGLSLSTGAGNEKPPKQKVALALLKIMTSTSSSSTGS